MGTIRNKDHDNDDENTWHMTYEIDGKEVLMTINVPPTACIGKYSAKDWIGKFLCFRFA